MIDVIEIKTELDDIYLQENIIFCVNNGTVSTNAKTLKISIDDDSTVTIPPGKYKLLCIDTNMGDININLPNTFFEDVKITSNMGDLLINTNYNSISFDAVMGEYKNLNPHQKKNNIKPLHNNHIKKAKKQLHTYKVQKNNDKDRYS